MQENKVYPIDIYDYDFENDSLFFNFQGINYESSIDVDDIILDIGVDGSPVGAEILNASEMFKVPKISLKNPRNFYAEILITEDTIEVKFTVYVEERNRKTEKVYTSHVINDENIPSAQVAMAY